MEIALADILKERIEQYKLGANQIALQYPSWAKITARRIIQRVVVDVIRKRMDDAKFSKKIIRSTKIDTVEIVKDLIRVKIRSEFFADTGFDVAVAREFGTKKHMIRPLFAPPNYATALRWVQDGKVRFSKGHEVSGIKSLHIIGNTITDQLPKAQQEFNEAFILWRREILEGM